MCMHEHYQKQYFIGSLLCPANAYGVPCFPYASVHALIQSACSLHLVQEMVGEKCEQLAG